MTTLEWRVGDGLPPELAHFTFNNLDYYWKMCDCGCSRPLAFTTSQDLSPYLTTLLRGFDQGDEVEDLLIRFFGLTEFTNVLYQEGKALSTIWIETVALIEPADGTINRSLLKEKDIHPGHYKLAKRWFASGYEDFLLARDLMENPPDNEELEYLLAS